MDITATQTSATASAFSGLARNIDTFLTLLTTQLKHQDPLEPLDTEKFTSQLVQFASVEQSIKTNENLQALIALQSAVGREEALAFVGRTATFRTDRASHQGQGAAWTYTLPQAASEVTLAIVDAQGRVAAVLQGDAARGSHSVQWDGRTTGGAVAPSGIYRLVVSARDAGGAALEAQVETTLHVEGAAFAADGAQLETAIGLLPTSLVTRIRADGVS